MTQSARDRREGRPKLDSDLSEEPKTFQDLIARLSHYRVMKQEALSRGDSLKAVAYDMEAKGIDETLTVLSEMLRV